VAASARGEPARPLIVDVARRAGVSHKTVSRVLITLFRNRLTAESLATTANTFGLIRPRKGMLRLLL
jgi:hypothetical protein